jgi:hypothetical protein
MTWNYRIIKKTFADNDAAQYEIHEVYYEGNSISGWTESSVNPNGASVAELREDIRYFLQAFKSPVLEEKIIDEKDVLIENDDCLEINDGHYFEFIDRTFVASEYIYQFLGSHPLIRKEEKLKHFYEKAASALAELYQEAGRLEFEKSEPVEK